MAIQIMYTLLDRWWREHKYSAIPADTNQLGFKITIVLLKYAGMISQV